MAVCACELLDLEGRDLPLGRHLVAFAAFHLHMFSHERELCEIVIEAAGEPVLRDVAPRTVGNALLHEVIAMHIVVAIRARVANVPEGPVLPILHVAGETRSSLVRAVQREGGLLMLFDAEHAYTESIGEEVAFHTIGRGAVLGEHAFMEVLVTTIARVEHNGVGVRPLVALLAIHPDVLALQRVVREVVIEIVHGAQGGEALLLVALGTVGPELPFVRILVAGCALVLQNTIPVLEHRQRIAGLLVALKAVRCLVLAQQLEMRRTVIESLLPSEHIESLLRVALRAGTGEVRLVRIFMARPAIGVRHIGEFLELLAASRGHLVALKAIDLHVPAAQREIRLRMIELLDWLERRHVMAAQAVFRERALVPVLVAGDTCLIQA